MPSWIIHIATANTLAKKIHMDEGEFIFGNIMPDILNGHIIQTVSKNIPYECTHDTQPININGIQVPMPNIQKFKQEQKKKLNNPLICGYYTHLLTDYFWNDYAYRNYYKTYDKGNDMVKVRLQDGSNQILIWDVAVKEKQKDFRTFSKYLQTKIDISSYINEDKIVGDSKSFTLTKQDIDDTILYIKNIKNLNIPVESYKIFSEEELMQVFNKTIDFILKNLSEKENMLGES